jgi:hypothetical protein
MMKKVLINNQEIGKICDVVEAGSEYAVHPDFQWINCEDDSVTMDYVYEENNGVYTFKEFNVTDLESTPEAKEEAFKIEREIGYGSIGAQLDMIYKEVMANGSISSDGEWATYITNVKANIPKK